MTRIISLLISILTTLLSPLLIVIGAIGVIGGPNYKTLNINGIEYRNYFAGKNLHLVEERNFSKDEPVYVETIRRPFSTRAAEIKYYAMDEDWVHRGSRSYFSDDAGATCFCPLDQWDALNSYYSNGENYRYYCEIYHLRDTTYFETQDFSSVDSQEYNKLIDVLEFVYSGRYRALPMEDYTTFRFFKESKDGIFYVMSAAVVECEGQYYYFDAINLGLDKVEVFTLPREQQETISSLLNQLSI